MAKGLMGFIEKLFGKKNRDMAKVEPLMEEVKAVRGQFESLSDDELRAKRGEFKTRYESGESLDDLLPEAFGVVWEGCRRLTERKASWVVWGQDQVWDMIPYDVQIIGGIVLHQGKIAEMATGEGKTLVALMPLYLNSIPGKGAHLVTVNDYLAQRDAQWMGGVLEFLGCSVGYILGPMSPAERREAYGCDVTYGTNNEFGFDYLRDNMVLHSEHLVHRDFHYAIVDEVDSVLIDEARTPLIISGAVDKSTQQFNELSPLVTAVVRKQTKIVNDWVSQAERKLRGSDEDNLQIDDETALLLLQISRGGPKNKRFRKLCQIPGVLEKIQKTEEAFMRDKAMWEADKELLYTVEEKNHQVDLTEKGHGMLAAKEPEFFVLPDLAERAGEIQDNENLSAEDKAKALAEVEQEYAQKNERISNVDQLLRAHSLYSKDVEYVIQEGKVVIVDTFTGRLQPGRRFSEGLHQALEAKEGLTVQKETQTLATVTVQNFFRMYDKLSGMTGTAETEEAEFNGIYELDVVVIPTHRPIARNDMDDVIYKTKKEKYKAIVDEVERLHLLGLPVLVGTTTVEVSELLSRLMKIRGINHNVLNAKQHKAEAEIVAEAGRLGAVTIATNMAGRGTDIKLSPEVRSIQDRWATDPNVTDEMVEGQDTGLMILGTERHESRRIDRQLRGRSGRQGDPGAAIFFLSLEDDLMRLFSPDRIIKVMDKLGVEEGEVITHGMVTKAIEKAQVRVETQNYEIRKHLLQYDDVVNKQREVIYGLRRSAVLGEALADDYEEFFETALQGMFHECTSEDDAPDFWDMKKLALLYQSTFLLPIPLKDDEHLHTGYDAVLNTLREKAEVRYQEKLQRLGPEVTNQLQKYVLLQILDEKWRDHLNELILLRSGIGLRSYGQRDPLIEYKKEAFTLFESMMESLGRQAVSLFMRAEIVRQPPQPEPKVDSMQTSHQETSAYEQAKAGGGDTGSGSSASSGPEHPAVGQPVKRDGAKINRNDPCPCGSGEKYKKCCGR